MFSSKSICDNMITGKNKKIETNEDKNINDNESNKLEVIESSNEINNNSNK